MTRLVAFPPRPPRPYSCFGGAVESAVETASEVEMALGCMAASKPSHYDSPRTCRLHRGSTRSPPLRVLPASACRLVRSKKFDHPGQECGHHLSSRSGH